MKEDITLSNQDGILVAQILRDIDHHSAKPMREKIDIRLFETKPTALIIDFSRVEFMDSSGLGLIMGRVEKASALGIPVYVSGMNRGLYRLARLAGLEKLKNLTLTN